MVKIFSKTVENNEIERKEIKLPRSSFQQLPNGEFSVRDNRSDRIWRCRRSQRSGQCYLNVIDGNDFVRGINAGSKISLHNEADPFNPEATPYKFEVENN
ncbi:hypothetical protein SLEP1_g33424 [Rubroshorea leprosula]|uniref:Uncharacterized protein n=1 Tax=Rubroshorea leprosula TaxID=152421 RepID=A0AAV5KGJ1_9ROSI|nr:hypothetical protein SLEP1_g33408 [Rubroshorea leprosula]GKV23722.1 hypothetical protein SLEP1_g33424 [Rubroshorea leprosula]